MKLEDLRERMIEDGVGALAVTKEGNAEYLFDVGVGGLFLVTQSSVESLVSGFHRYEFEELGTRSPVLFHQIGGTGGG